MIYAPVLIPTLNRYEHLRKCLESLSRCTLAEQTEVYVALDYPPSEKYVEGWKKNREFLHGCGDMGFKKLHLIERGDNYGTWGPGDKGNLKSLVEEVKKEWDVYICTEDDNIFAPSFLDYMNKGLCHFYNDESVIGICGYRHFYDFKFDNNTYFRQSVDYCAWGVARWSNKEIEQLNKKWFRNHLSIPNIIKVWKHNGRNKVITFLDSCSSKWKGRAIDQHVSIYLTLSGKQQIMPTVSLVKNIGFDGSGASFGEIGQELHNKFDSAPMSKEQYFEYIGSGYEHFKENQRIYRNSNFNKAPLFVFLKRLIKKSLKLIIYK